MMLKEKLVLKEQGQEGNYLFHDVAVLATAGFREAFQEEMLPIIGMALGLINSTYENPDYLQVFVYGERKFYVIAEFKRGEQPEDYEGMKWFYVTFLLPEEY